MPAGTGLPASVLFRCSCELLRTTQVGIALVGMSSLLSGEGSAQVDVSPSKMLLGMGLIVASQVSHSYPSIRRQPWLQDMNNWPCPDCLAVISCHS